MFNVYCAHCTRKVFGESQAEDFRDRDLTDWHWIWTLTTDGGKYLNLSIFVKVRQVGVNKRFTLAMLDFDFSWYTQFGFPLQIIMTSAVSVIPSVLVCLMYKMNTHALLKIRNKLVIKRKCLRAYDKVFLCNMRATITISLGDGRLFQNIMSYTSFHVLWWVKLCSFWSAIVMHATCALASPLFTTMTYAITSAFTHLVLHSGDQIWEPPMICQICERLLKYSVESHFEAASVKRPLQETCAFQQYQTRDFNL